MYGRILSPPSKLSNFEYSQKLLEAPSFELQDVYRALDVIAAESRYIQSAMYKFSKTKGRRNDKILYYNCTNFYFELEQGRGMFKYSVSKENRPKERSCQSPHEAFGFRTGYQIMSKSTV